MFATWQVALLLASCMTAAADIQCTAFSSARLRLPLRSKPLVAPRAAAGVLGLANVGMRVKLQKETQAEYGFQRWWDADWRGMQTDTIKDPEAQVCVSRPRGSPKSNFLHVYQP